MGSDAEVSGLGAPSTDEDRRRNSVPPPTEDRPRRPAWRSRTYAVDGDPLPGDRHATFDLVECDGVERHSQFTSERRSPLLTTRMPRSSNLSPAMRKAAGVITSLT